MSKITFRANEELVKRLERFDASKSEVMREALRAYLDEHEGSPGTGRDSTESGTTLDEMVAERIDAVLTQRLDERLHGSQDIDLTISLVGAEDALVRESGRLESPSPNDREPALTVTSETEADDRSCGQCGTTVAEDHVYCPNCGEKAIRRIFCDCGDELRSDWAFCPSCGRRTPAADVLDGP